MIRTAEVLIVRLSEFSQGILRGIGFVSVPEPFKEDGFISDKRFTLLIRYNKH
jgi:hypothetical protein